MIPGIAKSKHCAQQENWTGLKREAFMMQRNNGALSFQEHFKHQLGGHEELQFATPSPSARMSRSGTWGGEPELFMLSNFESMKSSGSPPQVPERDILHTWRSWLAALVSTLPREQGAKYEPITVAKKLQGLATYLSKSPSTMKPRSCQIRCF